MKMFTRSCAGGFIRLPLLLCAICFGTTALRAADHADGPTASNDAAADLADIFFFLDPNDNTRVVMSMTERGFIVPGEAVNQAIFDPTVLYQFQIEETGDAKTDALINVTFSKRASNSAAQIATVQMFRGTTKVFDFVAPATNPSLAATAPPQVVTTDSVSQVKFFAGEVDDPFFFDIPAFSRFVSSVLAGSPNAAVFNRARDSFAGYNVMAISLSIPKTLLQSANNSVGVSAATFRADKQPATLLANLSTRGSVEGGDKVLIGGTIISGNTSKRVIVRAIGPSLTASGVPGALSDPTLKIINSQAQVVASNDNWQESQATEITGTGLAPKDPKESAIIATLQPGAYTAIVDGAGGAKGLALVEVYDLETSSTVPTAMRQIDREGIPAVNVALVPFSRKDEYNTSNPQEDAAGRFAGDIVGTLKALGTNDANIGILASVAVTNGDILRLNLNTANSGTGGGNNPAAAFPNGRRLGDDTIDTLLTIITNSNASGFGDNVNANDLPLKDTFPFFALSQQPRDTGVIDDNTRN